MILPAFLVLFWLMQAAANVAFKCGSGPLRPRRWLLGFLAGNVVGASSIYFLMRIYELMPGRCNLAAVLAGGGTFVGSQLILFCLFRPRLTFSQWCGIAAVMVGTAIATLFQPAP